MTQPSLLYPPPQPAPPAPPRAKLSHRRWFPWALGTGCLFVGAGLGSAGGGTGTVDAGPAGVAPATVTVTQGATGKVAPVAKPAPAKAAATIDGDGTFLVPGDVKPGTYRAGKPDLNCYWARLRSADGSMNSIIANGNTSGSVVVTIKASDKAFTSTGCATWTRVG